MSEERKHIEVVAAIIKKDNTILPTPVVTPFTLEKPPA